MSITHEKAMEILEVARSSETDYDKGYHGAKLWCLIHDKTPEELKAEIKAAPVEQQHDEFDRGGIAWCDEQIALRS